MTPVLSGTGAPAVSGGAVATPLLFFVIIGIPDDLHAPAAGQDLSRPDASPGTGF
jgi:hypothetical protein